MNETVSRGTQEMGMPSGVRYAGFWWRVLAAILDVIFIMLIFMGLAILLMILGVLSGMPGPMMEQGGEPSVLEIFIVIVLYILSILYEPLFLSSKYQATLGMMVLNIQIVDMNFQRISFGKAFLRYLAQILSGLILYIGYIMIAFTEKKQGLHDIMVGTLVIRK